MSTTSTILIAPTSVPNDDSSNDNNQQYLLPQDQYLAVTGASNVINVISLVLSLTGVFLHWYSKRKNRNNEPDTLSIRFGLYLQWTNVVYHSFQLLSNNLNTAGFFCSLSTWGWIFATNMTVFYSAAIAHNIQVAVLQTSAPRIKLDLFYKYFPIAISLVIATIPAIFNQYGVSVAYGSCWFLDENSFAWSTGVLTLPTFLGIFYCVTIIALVVLKVLKKARRMEPNSTSFHSKHGAGATNNPTPQTNNLNRKASNSKNQAKKMAHSIFIKLIPFPALLFFTQFPLALSVFWTDITLLWNIIFYCSFSMQGTLHFCVFLLNPQLLSFRLSKAETFAAIEMSPPLSDAFSKFLSKLYCAENWEFHVTYRSFCSNFQAYYENSGVVNPGLSALAQSLLTIRTKYFSGSEIEGGTEAATAEILNLPAELRKRVMDLFSKPKSRQLLSILSSIGKGGSETKVPEPDLGDFLLSVRDLLEEVDKHLKEMLINDSIPKFTRTQEYRKLEEQVRLQSIKVMHIDENGAVKKEGGHSSVSH